MTERIVIRKNTYHDSAFLMRISRELCRLKGVHEAVVLMGTEMNQNLLQEAGFNTHYPADVTPMDLMLALRTENDDAITKAEDELSRLLLGESASTQSTDSKSFGSLEEALAQNPTANLVSIAVPGVYAAFPAHQALNHGKHVFLFSNNVPLEDEIALKSRALRLGLLVMGPDCGTAILQGVGLGFSNRVPSGPIGIVGPSGTGIQELCCAMSRLGVGISQAIGTGSRDLSLEVNGMMTEFALRILQDDPATRVIVLVAKHPDEQVARRIHQVLLSLGKPTVVRYLGLPPPDLEDEVYYAHTLDEASEVAVARVEGREVLPGTGLESLNLEKTLSAEQPKVQGRLVGLFSGGSLAAEARYLLNRIAGLDPQVPDRPVEPGRILEPAGHLMIDTGEDFYTVGRPHPMVDQTVRCKLIHSAISDPSVGLLLFDLVLGDGAHPDPAPEIVGAIHAGLSERSSHPVHLVASVSGTVLDPQDRGRQFKQLTNAGVWVQPSATQAALLAANLMRARSSGEPT